MKKITIPYFSKGIQYVTPVIFGGGIYILLTGHPVWAGVLALLAVIILTTKYVTAIDLDKKEYRDYLSFLGMPLDEEKCKFSSIDKIVITKENHSQVLNSKVQTRQLDWSSFTGILLLDKNKTLNLLTRNNKRELVEGLREFAVFLKVDIEDQTTSRHYIVDLTKV